VREQLGSLNLPTDQLALAACSGGADSMALAAALAFEAPRLGLRAGAVIVEHGLQPETKAVAQRTAAVLADLGLAPVLVKAVQVTGGGGPEAAARAARYAALDQARVESGAAFVLLAHTLNDQAETVLLGLQRGSGARSLSGMAPQNDCYLRPLLGITRQTTEAFCADSGLQFWSDPQNQDPAFARVRVRHDVLPVLENTLGPGIAQALARTADQLREDADLLDGLAAASFEKIAKVQATTVELPIEALAAEPRALATRVIRLALTKFGPSHDAVHIDSAYDLVINWHGQKPLALRGVRVERKGPSLKFSSTKPMRPGAC
jgi:tRNA(Ile)-lysidine synthase